MSKRPLIKAKEQLAQQIIFSVSEILAQDIPYEDALKSTLRSMCEQMGWLVGSFWTFDGKGKALKCEMICSLEPCPHFEAVTRTIKLKKGVGLPGRVWKSGTPVWISDVTEDTNFPRNKEARADGLHNAFAFPVSVRGKLSGVYEFFSKEMSRPDTDLIDAFSVVGTQIGLFFEKRRIEHELESYEEKLRISEGRFREFAGAVDEVFFVGSPRLTEFYYVSPGYEKVWGSPAAQVLADPQAWAKAVVPEHRERVGDYVKLLQGDDMPDQSEIDYAITRADGKRVWLSARCFRIDQGDGSWHICGTVRDITDRKEAEARIGEFYSLVSHELRTPLTTVKGSLLLLERGKANVDTARRQDLIELARKECDRLIRLINDFLDIKTIEAGRLQLYRQKLHPADIVEQTMQTMAVSAAGRKIKLKQEIQTELAVFADQDRIVQVITNLLSNAIKFSPPGGQVLVSTQKKGKSVRFSVTDQGPGIAAKDKSKLFKVFQKIAGKKGANQPGTGLGLAICKGIVEEHGGRIAVDTSEGEGATFWFELPVAPP